MTVAVPAAAIVLAAGLGTRMRSTLPKALHPIAGRPMLRHLLAAAEPVFEQVVVVVGPGMPALEQAAAPHPTVVQHDRLGTAHAALQDSAPNRWIKGPPSLDHRYLHEDVGWGLVPWAELGSSLGVETPLMDALITVGSVLTGRDYRSEGLTLRRLGLAGKRVDELPDYLWEGIASGKGAATMQVPR